LDRRRGRERKGSEGDIEKVGGRWPFSVDHGERVMEELFVARGVLAFVRDVFPCWNSNHFVILPSVHQY